MTTKLPKNIVFYGSGLSTVAIYEGLKSYDCNFFWIEDNNSGSAKQQLINLAPDADQTLLILSPGVPIAKVLDLQPYVSDWIGAIEFETRFFKAHPLIGVTGSAGKTVTVELLHHILSSFGLKSVTFGNIGKSLFSYNSNDLESCIFIGEFSSYQLEHHRYDRFDFSILTSLFENHISRHGSFENYFKAKLKILENLDPKGLAVINIDHKYRDYLLNFCKQKGFRFKTVSEFDSDADLLVDISGMRIKTKSITIRSIPKHLPFFDRLAFVIPILEEFCSWSEDDLMDILDAFKAPPYRFQITKNFGSKIHPRYVINDSKSTSLKCVLRALNLAENLNQPVVLMLGGRLKTGENLLLFLEELLKKKDRIRQVITFGESGSVLSEEIKKRGFKVINFENLRSVSFSEIDSSCSILFSPGCESFDEFKSFEDRGQAFDEIANFFFD
ncbi:MAG: Mur ligase family protein [Deltaproteobacteria bacterium]|nr:Mur ligase family protein [Deltaproteobacteria bacterium]